MASELVLDAKEVGKKASEEGVPRLRKLNSFYEQCVELVSQLEDEKQRAEQLKNRDLIVRNKHAKKMAKTVKQVNQLFNKINQSFLKGEIKEEEGKIFAEALKETIKEGISSISRPSCATCHVARMKPLAGKTSRAREKLSNLDSLVLLFRKFQENQASLKKEYREASKEVERLEEELKTEKRRGELKKHAEKNLEDVKKTEKLEKFLREYEQLRQNRLQELSDKPAARLIGLFLASKNWQKLGFPTPEDKNSLKELKEFLEKDLSGLSLKEVIEYSGFNQKKLAHYTPQPRIFQGLVEKNANWISQASRLQETVFLKVKEQDAPEKFEQVASCLGKNKASSLVSNALQARKNLDLEKARQAKKQWEKVKDWDENRLKQLEKQKKQAQKRLEETTEVREKYFKK
jgi:hypothetical protein